MTLQELFDQLASHPQYIIFYFILLPLTAILAGFMGKGEGHLSPWKYLYSTLVYLACVPGIFAVTLNVYMFLFEKRSILATDVYTQILPILSMVLTLLIIKRNVSLDAIPGFDKLSVLIMMITATLLIMWGLDRTHFLVFVSARFEQALIVFIVLLIAVRFGWKKLFSGGPAGR